VGHSGQGAWAALLEDAGRRSERFRHSVRLALALGHTVDDYRDSLVLKTKEAKARGFRAGKMEVIIKGPYAHNGLDEDDEAIVEIVAACREAAGPDFVMMVDVGYCWRDAKEALRVLKRLEPFDVFFLETRSRSRIWMAMPFFTITRRSGSPRENCRTRGSSFWS